MTEFAEALEHALEGSRDTKVLLRAQPQEQQQVAVTGSSAPQPTQQQPGPPPSTPPAAAGAVAMTATPKGMMSAPRTVITATATV